MAVERLLLSPTFVNQFHIKLYGVASLETTAWSRGGIFRRQLVELLGQLEGQ